MEGDIMTSTTIDSKSTGSKLADSWIGGIDLRMITDHVGTPVFVYSEEQISKNIHRIKDAAGAAGLDGRVELYIPFFPYSNPHLLRPFQEMGVVLLLQMPSEYRILLPFGFE